MDGDFEIGDLIEIVIDGEFVLESAATSSYDTNTEEATLVWHIFFDNVFDFICCCFGEVDIHDYAPPNGTVLISSNPSSYETGWNCSSILLMTGSPMVLLPPFALMACALLCILWSNSSILSW